MGSARVLVSVLYEETSSPFMRACQVFFYHFFLFFEGKPLRSAEQESDHPSFSVLPPVALLVSGCISFGPDLNFSKLSQARAET